ncbi:MAG TPA: tRNA (uridine(34)/cytosine(34)/5-carboxymethylaminomethyluridine(34)-2'-O)-methyltransferase TrmL [Bacillota bacterium]|nr:tRNA (uridine(34)/cytosine(34)/5-carboxymethylaminomethyluridine(34)-2'-O)-methyltransferase TrmL [Bacillota bacterium]
MSLHVVLFEPEIPANTGNIARTCLATGSTLHLIHPLGFSTEDKMLERAGLDYWPHVDVQEHASIEELYDKYPEGTYYYIENFGTKYYTDNDYSNSDTELFFVFGKESTGIPKQLLMGKEDKCLRVPMTSDVRSLNLANTAAILIYEALRQQNFVHIS